MKKFLALALVALSFTACKKDKPEDEGGSNAVQLTLVQSTVYQYSTVIIEANASISDFDNKVVLNGTETSAAVVEGNNIAFLVQPEVPAGNHKLQLTVNGQNHELDITVNALPAISNPQVVVTNYATQVNTVNQQTKAALDTLYKRLNLTKGQDVTDIESELAAVEDSLQDYLAEFNALPADQQKIAASMIEASRLKLQSVYEFMNDYNDFIINGSGLGKKSSICNIPGNPSEAWKCVLNETRKNVRILLKEAIINAAIGGTLGGITGLILGPAGAAVGAKVGAVTALLMNIKSIINFKNTLLANFEAAFVVTVDEVSGKQAITFPNDEAKAISIKINRRNLQLQDMSSAHAFVSGYLGTTFEFLQFIKTKLSKYIKSVPNFMPLRQARKPIDNLDFAAFSVVENNKVQLVAVGGTKDNPTLKFKTDETSIQSFKFKMVYNDGVYSRETVYQGTLSPCDDPKTCLELLLASKVWNLTEYIVGGCTQTAPAGCKYTYTTTCTNSNGSGGEVELYDRFYTVSGTFTFNSNGNITSRFVQEVEHKVLTEYCNTKIETSTESDPQTGTWVVNSQGNQVTITIDGDAIAFDMVEMSPDKLVFLSTDGDIKLSFK